ncbi:MAG: hypothetical protein F7B60_03005 [Desulfurococcales archaeon]|nr:hypothetical protein [Desulfurococcales archaeon]
MNRNVSYEQVSAGIRAVRNNARLIATNRGELLPSSTAPKLGAGGIASMIEISGGLKAWAITGKPSDILRDILIDLVGSLWNSVFIGDKLSTDGEQARIMGIPAIMMGKQSYDVTRKDNIMNVLFVNNLLEVS